jgi:hypothetical protein
MTIHRKVFLPTLVSLLLIGCLIFTSASSTTGARAYSKMTNSSNSIKNAVSGSVQIARALHSGQLKLSGTYASERAHPNMTCSPAPCVLPNVQASEGGQPVNETAIAVNPNNPQDILTGANDYNCTSSLAGFYASSNGGNTWKTNCMGTLSGATGCGDPGVGYDLNNVAYATSLENCDSSLPSSILLEKSTDNGTTWSAPTVAVKPFIFDGEVDKSWLQVDVNPGSPHANALYISVTQFDSSFNASLISVSHSNDGGNTWVTTPVEPETPFNVVDQFSALTIGKNGTVYVSWLRCFANGPQGDCGDTIATFYLSKSTDGGNTWSKPTVIGDAVLAPDACPSKFPCFYGSLPNTPERVSDIPVIGIDNSTGPHHGYLYASFYTWTGNYMAVEVATSTDSGTTWGASVPVALPSNTHDQFFPWLSVSLGGIVDITWLDRRNDPQNISYKMYFTSSTTGGVSFAKNKSLATALSNPFNDGFGGAFIGDYTGNTWTTSTTPTLYACWMDTRNTVTSQNEVGGSIQ